MKYTWIILIFLFIFLQYKLWFAPGNAFDVLSFEQSVRGQEYENETRKLRNQQLEAEVDNLKTGTDAEEERARGELGMIKKGEVFYQFVEE